MINLRKLNGKAVKARKASTERQEKAQAEFEAFKERKKKDNARKWAERELKATTHIGGVPFMTVDGMKVVNILDWVVANAEDDSDEKLYKWCQAHKAHYYTHQQADFDLKTAIKETIEFNRQVVVVEEK